MRRSSRSESIRFVLVMSSDDLTHADGSWKMIAVEHCYPVAGTTEPGFGPSSFSLRLEYLQIFTLFFGTFQHRNKSFLQHGTTPHQHCTKTNCYGPLHVFRPLPVLHFEYQVSVSPVVSLPRERLLDEWTWSCLPAFFRCVLDTPRLHFTPLHDTTLHNTSLNILTQTHSPPPPPKTSSICLPAFNRIRFFGQQVPSLYYEWT